MPFDFTDEETTTRRLRRLLIAIPPALLLPFLVYFWGEIKDVLSILWLVIAVFLGADLPQISPTLIHSFIVLAFTFLFGFGFFYVIWLYLFASQAWLPVSNLEEIYQTAMHFRLFARRKHGPAVFVKDGKLNASPDELRRHKPGVLVIDYNSAVALERVVPGLDWKRPIKDLLTGERPGNRYQRARICGPGIAFTRASERIRGVGDVKDRQTLEEINGVVDLRIQSRSNEKWLAKEPEPKGPRIGCYSRDGIELKSGVSARFTIGQQPEIVQVTYRGERRPENLVVVSLETTPEKLIRVKDFSERDELDEEDILEIHRYAAGLRFPDGYEVYRSLDPSSPSSVPDFDKDRVFAAVYATARTPERDVIPWLYLPSHVALDMFREIISRTNYDELYTLDEKGKPRIGEVQRKLRLKMRNNGLLSYRLVYHCSRANLVKGAVYRPEELLVSPVRPLTYPKMLRERGIKVIASGFSDLIPVSEAVYKQRLDSWRATWETDAAIARAGYELEAMRIYNRARAQAQQELANSLSQIFEIEGYSDEVLAIHIFQALEKIASDPQTHKLLPADTINLLRTVHDWLLPQAGPPVLRPTAR